MSDDSVLRSKLIRLASAKPELRASILPLLTDRVARGPAPTTFEGWVEGRKFKNPETGRDVQFKSLPSEEQTKIRSKWKAKADKKKGPASGAKNAPPKELGDLLSGWHEKSSDPIYEVASNAAAGKPVDAKVVAEAVTQIKKLLPAAKGKDKDDLNKALSMMGEQQAEAPAAAAPKAEKPAKTKKPARSYKKNYGKAMESVMDKHNLTDGDAEKVMEFKKERPRKGQKQSPAELMRRFLEKAKPETKERMKGVTPQEFVKMLGAILSDEDGGEGMGKAASSEGALRSQLIRLAHARPEFRDRILPLLVKQAGEDADGGESEENEE